MENEMKILMIGNKSSGKTTYMASAYGIMRDGIYGFYVRGDADTDSFLHRMYSLIQNGSYPLPTDKRLKYEFKLYHYQTELLTFEWIDYYGGVITESKSEELQNDMDNADAIMLFIDADALYRNDRQITQLRRALYLISTKLISMDNQYNVIIVLTKYDKVPVGISFEKVCSPLTNFLDSIKGKENIYSRVVPVSCTENGFINVDLPLIDILDSGVSLKYISHALSANEHAEHAVALEKDSGVFDWAISRLLGVPTNHEMAVQEAEKAKKLIEIAERIEEPCRKLRQYCIDYRIAYPNTAPKNNNKKTSAKVSRFKDL